MKRKQVGVVQIQSIYLILSLLVCGWVSTASEAQAKTQPGPKYAAQSWLALMDAGNFAEAWKAAAPVLQQKISEADWQKLGLEIAEKFGKVQKRKPLETVHLQEAPGIGPGDYLVMLYRTACQKYSQGLYEKLTLMKVDGVWKVAGYYLQ